MRNVHVKRFLSSHKAESTSLEICAAAVAHTGAECSYCGPVLLMQMSGQMMMNAVVISPQHCTSGRKGIDVEPLESHPTKSQT